MEQEGLLCSGRQWVSVGRDGISSPHDQEPNCPITGAGHQVGGTGPKTGFLTERVRGRLVLYW